jgi:hypothetical protein
MLSDFKDADQLNAMAEPVKEQARKAVRYLFRFSQKGYIVFPHWRDGRRRKTENLFRKEHRPRLTNS